MWSSLKHLFALYMLAVLKFFNKISHIALTILHPLVLKPVTSFTAFRKEMSKRRPTCERTVCFCSEQYSFLLLFYIVPLGFSVFKYSLIYTSANRQKRSLKSFIQHQIWCEKWKKNKIEFEGGQDCGLLIDKKNCISASKSFRVLGLRPSGDRHVLHRKQN